MSSDSDDWDVPDEGTFQKVDTDAIVAAEEAAKEQERARAKADAEAKKLANAKQAEAAKREETRSSSWTSPRWTQTSTTGTIRTR
jgi:membrane protein involved in colicin uptake